MDEAILIEIAARFRRLEELCKAAEEWLPAEPNQNNCDQFATRDAICESLDACRSDMERMQNTIRSNRR